MNWEFDASNLEINCRAAEALGLIIKPLDTYGERYRENYPDTIWVAPADESGQQCDVWYQFNATGSSRDVTQDYSCWHDAGPMLETFGIGIMKNDDGSWKAFTNIEGQPQFAIEVNAENPCKAIAIAACVLSDSEVVA